MQKIQNKITVNNNKYRTTVQQTIPIALFTQLIAGKLANYFSLYLAQLNGFIGLAQHISTLCCNVMAQFTAIYAIPLNNLTHTPKQVGHNGFQALELKKKEVNLRN